MFNARNFTVIVTITNKLFVFHILVILVKNLDSRVKIVWQGDLRTKNCCHLIASRTIFHLAFEQSATTATQRSIIHNILSNWNHIHTLRCMLRFKGLVICFYLGWSGSILQIRNNIIKVGSKSWILTCSCHITLSLPFYTYPASKRELNFYNGYLSLLYFWCQQCCNAKRKKNETH